MDKLYKPHFLSQLKVRMQTELPVFATHRTPPSGHPLRSRFSSSKLYLKRLPMSRCLWLEWLPGDGVEREFCAFLGWSNSVDMLPTNKSGDHRIYDVRGPMPDLPCGIINVQQIEGRQAIGGFTIATPWDQLHTLPHRVSEDERKRAMDRAYAQYLAVTDAERIEAVRRALNAAFKSIVGLLPVFENQLERMHSDAYPFTGADA